MANLHAGIGRKRRRAARRRFIRSAYGTLVTGSTVLVIGWVVVARLPRVFTATAHLRYVPPPGEAISGSELHGPFAAIAKDANSIDFIQRVLSPPDAQSEAAASAGDALKDAMPIDPSRLIIRTPAADPAELRITYHAKYPSRAEEVVRRLARCIAGRVETAGHVGGPAGSGGSSEDDVRIAAEIEAFADRRQGAEKAFGELLEQHFLDAHEQVGVALAEIKPNAEPAAQGQTTSPPEETRQPADPAYGSDDDHFRRSRQSAKHLKLEGDLLRLMQRRRVLLKRVTPAHPELKRIEADIRAIEEQLKAHGRASPPPGESIELPVASQPAISAPDSPPVLDDGVAAARDRLLAWLDAQQRFVDAQRNDVAGANANLRRLAAELRGRPSVVVEPGQVVVWQLGTTARHPSPYRAMALLATGCTALLAVGGVLVLSAPRGPFASLDEAEAELPVPIVGVVTSGEKPSRRIRNWRQGVARRFVRLCEITLVVLAAWFLMDYITGSESLSRLLRGPAARSEAGDVTAR